MSNKFEFKNIDFIGNQPNFLVNQSSRFKTNLGAVFTLLISIGRISFGISEIIVMINGSNPIVSMSNEFQSNFTFNATNKVPLFIASHRKGNIPIPELEKYLTLNPSLFYNLPFNETTGKSGSYILPLKTFPCKNMDNMALKYGSKLSKMFENNGPDRIGRAMCLDLDNSLELKGVLGEVPAVWLQILVERCKNSTISNIVCKPREEINELLQDIVVYLSFGDKYYDNFNKTASIDSLNSNSYLFSSTSLRTVYLGMQVVDYKTDFGLIFPDIKTETNYQVKGSSILMTLTTSGLNDSIGEFVYRFTKVKLVYSRKYMKIPELLAKIG